MCLYNHLTLILYTWDPVVTCSFSDGPGVGHFTVVCLVYYFFIICQHFLSQRISYLGINKIHAPHTENKTMVNASLSCRSYIDHLSLDVPRGEELSADFCPTVGYLHTFLIPRSMVHQWYGQAPLTVQYGVTLGHNACPNVPRVGYIGLIQIETRAMGHLG